MRAITKANEPPSLTEHRCSEHADYDNYVDKVTLRQYLVREQRGLCCYCLSRIRAASEAMKIEHWHCQDHYPAEQLDYANLLGSCLGGEGQAWKFQHCDTRKRNQDLSRNPANRAHQVERLFRYLGDGTIVSDDAIVEREINDVLNLNAPFLKASRKSVLEAFKATFAKRGTLERITLERLLQEWNGQSHADELRPYCQVVVYWLTKRLQRSA
jgi:uncharacterized protein (TIGR02646 family)